MRTPVALIIFNRPHTTERVFAEIAKARPPKLLVIADGPRPDRPDDVEKCAATRAIIDRVDWNCEVSRNFSEVNLGCGVRPATGLSWVFEHVEEAIILEDDCLPHPTFFQFCDEALAHHREDDRVMMVSGNNMIPGSGDWKTSYTYFRFLNLWGWATWRRAWKKYDFAMESWPEMRRTDWLGAVAPEPRMREYWRRTYDDIFVHADRNDVWDFQFAFALMRYHGLGIAPCVNLVENIGFGPDATHTTFESDLARVPTRAMKFPLRHPKTVAVDADYDRLVFDHVFNSALPRPLGIRGRLKQTVTSMVPIRAKRNRYRRRLTAARAETG